MEMEHHIHHSCQSDQGKHPRPWYWIGMPVSEPRFEICSSVPPSIFLHERVVHGDNKDLASLLELGVVDVAGDVGARASRAWNDGQHGRFFSLPCSSQSRTKSSRNTDNDTLALELLGEVDLVAG